MGWDQAAGSAGSAVLPATGTTGAPTAGSWLTGQVALDSNGFPWLCTAGGAPGTWVGQAIGTMPGGYAQITANQTGITTQTDVTGLTATVTVSTGRRIKITAFSNGLLGTLQWGTLFIMEGASQISFSRAGTDSAAFAAYNSACIAQVVLTPTAGAHTYKVQARNDGTANAMTVQAAANGPAYISVEDMGS